MTSSVTDLCRLCGTDTFNIVRHHIFEAEGLAKDIAKKIADCLPVTVTPQDRLPKHMCGECAYKLDLLSEFRDKAVKTEHLLESLVDGVKPEILENEEPDNDLGADDGFRSDSPDQQEPEVLIKEEEAEARPERRPVRKAARKVGRPRGRKRKQTEVEPDTEEEESEEAPKKAAKKEEAPAKVYRKRGRKPKNNKESPGRRYGCCGRRFGSPEAMQKHECSALRLLTCNHCQQMYSSLASMRRHVKRQHMSTHTCHACGARYSNPFTLRRHREVCLPTSCSQCHEIFPSKAALERHMRLTHDAQFVCRFCGKRYALQAKLADHERSHTNERPFVCDLCPNKAFTSKAYLLAHMKHKHIPRKDKLCCDVCRKSFASVKGLRSHRVTHFAELKKYICHICKAAFHARHNLASHQLVHTGEKAFTCEVCGAPFTRRSSLKAHISFKHSDELATHLCPECGKRFPQTSHLKRHLLTHTGERSHLCDVCGKSFSQVAHLHTHKRLRHKVLPYGCVDCGKQFKLKTDLLTHMGEH